ARDAAYCYPRFAAAPWLSVVPPLHDGPPALRTDKHQLRTLPAPDESRPREGAEATVDRATRPRGSDHMDEAVRAFMTFLDVERGASPETLRSYASDLRQFVSFMTAGASGIRPVDPATVQSDSARAYLQWLDRKREKRASLARKLACLRSFFRYLQREGLVLRNPADDVRSPKQSKQLPRVLTKD